MKNREKPVQKIKKKKNISRRVEDTARPNPFQKERVNSKQCQIFKTDVSLPIKNQ